MESAATRREFLVGGPLMAEIADLAAMAASDRASPLTAAVLNATCGEIAD